MSVSALVASLAVRAASLDLCADEYLLLLARPGEIVSTSYLAQDPAESPLWRRARAVNANSGTIESVLVAKPTLIVTTRPPAPAQARIARHLGIRTVLLPPAETPKQVEQSLIRVAAALGDAGRATPFTRRVETLRRTPAAQRGNVLMLMDGGLLAGPESPTVGWLRLAGLAPRAERGGRIGLEALLLRPPSIIIDSAYRRSQRSSGEAWRDHPIVQRARAKARTIPTDGRVWTCAGPLAIAEVERLKALQQ